MIQTQFIIQIFYHYQALFILFSLSYSYFFLSVIKQHFLNFNYEPQKQTLFPYFEVFLKNYSFYALFDCFSDPPFLSKAIGVGYCLSPPLKSSVPSIVP